MNPEQVNRSKYLSWLLRHGAGKEGVLLDESGWTSLDDVLRVSGLLYQEIDDLVHNDPKHRLQIEGWRIRACQGHSRGSGVTQAGLETSWQPYTLDAPVWHGTTIDSAERIAVEGILPVERTHVHCAAAGDSMVGKRGNVHLLLKIDPSRLRKAGFVLYAAPNGVVLVRSIPRDSISGLIPLTKRAIRQAPALRAAMGLPPDENDPVIGAGGQLRPTPEDPLEST